MTTRLSESRLDGIEVVIESILVNYRQLAGRVRHLEKLADVWDSPWWKLALFVLDGWPMKRVVARPQWRPWRKWWTS